MKKRSSSIEMPQKKWHHSFKRSDRQRLHVTKQLFFYVIVFLFLFLLSSGVLYLYYIKSPTLLTMLNPLGKSPVFEKSLRAELDKAHIDIALETVNGDGSVMVKLAQNGTTVYFSPDKPAASQVSSLQAIATQLTIDGRKAYRIDFRFDVPVISSESL